MIKFYKVLAFSCCLFFSNSCVLTIQQQIQTFLDDIGAKSFIKKRLFSFGKHSSNEQIQKEGQFDAVLITALVSMAVVSVFFLGMHLLTKLKERFAQPKKVIKPKAKKHLSFKKGLKSGINNMSKNRMFLKKGLIYEPTYI